MMRKTEILKKHDTTLLGRIRRATIDSEAGTAYLLSMPVTIFLFAIFIYPLFHGLVLSLYSTRKALISPTYVGLKNYISIFTSELFWLGVKNTVVFTVGTVTLTVGFGLLVALLLHNIDRGVWLYRAILILPLGFSAVVSGMTWQMMLNPMSGIVNYVLKNIGLPQPLWHTGFDTAMLTVVLIESWQWTPFPLFVIYAGLQSLPAEPFEAARIDGATAWQRIRYITLPMAWPIISLALMFRLIGAFRAFDVLYTVTKGGPGRATDALIIQAYQESFSYFRMEYGLVVGTVMLLVTIGMVVLLFRRVLRQS